MNMFERASAAWHVQREAESAARAKLQQRQRDQFESLLKQITGADVFSVQGAGDGLTAEIEGVGFIPVVNFHTRSQSIMGIRIAYKDAGEKENFSREICTSGDLGRELERLKNEAAQASERAIEKPESGTHESIEHLLSIFS